MQRAARPASRAAGACDTKNGKRSAGICVQIVRNGSNFRVRRSERRPAAKRLRLQKIQRIQVGIAEVEIVEVKIDRGVSDIFAGIVELVGKAVCRTLP